MLQSLQIVPYRAEQAIISGPRKFLFKNLSFGNSWKAGVKIPKKLAAPHALSLEALTTDTTTET